MQPHGEKSAQFPSILGILAKCGTRRLPLHCKTWRQVPKDKKEAVWAEIQVYDFTNKELMFSPYIGLFLHHSKICC